MKRLHALEEGNGGLLDDPLNTRIIGELVSAGRSVAELSRKFDVPMVKTWRRVAKLTKAGIVEQTGSKRIRNLESKVYRARAARYVTKKPRSLSKGRAVREAYELDSNIQKDIASALSRFEQVPQGVDTVDFATFTDMHAFCHVLLRPDTTKKLVELRGTLTRLEGFADIAPAGSLASPV